LQPVALVGEGLQLVGSLGKWQSFVVSFHEDLTAGHISELTLSLKPIGQLIAGDAAAVSLLIDLIGARPNLLDGALSVRARLRVAG
jgi:hypothetical protein